MAARVVCESCGGPNDPGNSFCRFCQAPLGFARKKAQRVGGKLLGDAEKPALPRQYDPSSAPPTQEQPKARHYVPSGPPTAVVPRAVIAPKTSAAKAPQELKKKRRVPKVECPGCKRRILQGMLFCSRCGFCLAGDDGAEDAYCGTCGSAKVDRLTGQPGGKNLVCGKCEPGALQHCDKGAFAHRDARRSIRVDAATARLEVDRLATTVGSLLYSSRHSVRPAKATGKQLIAWKDLNVSHEIGEGGLCVRAPVGTCDTDIVAQRLPLCMRPRSAASRWPSRR